MGGAGPYICFSPYGCDPDAFWSKHDIYDPAFWAKHTGLTDLGEEREAAYARGADFLNERKMSSVNDHGWKALPDGTNLFVLTTKGDIQFRLPRSFDSFLRPDELKEWDAMFTRPYIFDAKRHGRMDSYLSIDGPKAIADIFYLLQVLAPGMLLIVRLDDIDDPGECQTSRVLPPIPWVKDHEEALEHVLGSKERYQKLLGAATDYSTSFHTEWCPMYDDPEADDSSYYTDMWGVRQALDYTACSADDCGYCGRCSY